MKVVTGRPKNIGEIMVTARRHSAGIGAQTAPRQARVRAEPEPVAIAANRLSHSPHR